MKRRNIIRYIFSLFAGISSFILTYGLMQYFVVRNIPSDSVVSEVAKLILNFATAGFVSGSIYAVTFKHGSLPIAIIPAISTGGPLLAVAIVRGKIGGIESPTVNAWQFAIPVLVGVYCGYIGAKIVRRIMV